MTERVDQLAKLAEELRTLDSAPVGTGGRTRRMLVVTGEMGRLIDSLRDDAIKEALRQRHLTMREIGQLVGLSAPQVLKRGRDAGIDTSRPAMDPMQWRPSA